MVEMGAARLRCHCEHREAISRRCRHSRTRFAGSARVGNRTEPILEAAD
jgi:hypothetical protein